MKKLLLISICAFFAGCAPSVSTKLLKTTYQAFGPETTVYIIDVKDQVREMSVPVGDLKIGESGFTKNCSYNEVLDKAKIAAIKAGANVIKLTEIKAPDFASTCYRIKAKLYRNTDAEALAKLNDKLNAKNKSRLPEDADYAIIHFYRPNAGAGFLLGYKIKSENDSIIGRLRNGEKFTYKTNKFGLQEFFGELETKESVKIDVKKGQEYFVRCAVEMGIVLGRPVIKIVENHLGIKEYETVEK